MEEVTLREGEGEGEGEVEGGCEWFCFLLFVWKFLRASISFLDIRRFTKANQLFS